MSSQRYEIRKRIGQGGLGAVYAAYDTSLHREVAIKRVLTDTDEDIEQLKIKLIQEAKTLSALQHPNIVTVYDVGTDEEGPFLVMELLKGETLDATIERGALPMEDFRDVAVQTLEAMISAHHSGLIHRDLKPANIMLKWLPSGKFQLKILDFGLAKFSTQPSLQTIDHSDSILGSIYFMAPEQFERAPLDIRTDLYSMGGIYYYTLTSVYPFQGESAPQVMASHLTGRYTPIEKIRPDLPPWVGSWLGWLMSRNIEDRPADPGEALKAFLAQRGGAETTQFLAKPKTVNIATNVPVPARPTPGINAPMIKPAGGVVVPKSLPPKISKSVHLEVEKVKPVTILDQKETTLSVFQRFPRWAMVTIPLLILLVGGTLTKKVLDSKKARARSDQFQLLINDPEITPTMNDIKLLYSYLSDRNENVSRQAADVMSKMRPSKDLDAHLISHADEISGEVQTINLIKVLGLRSSPTAFPMLMNKAKTGATPLIRQSALGALAQVTSPADLPALIALLPTLQAADRNSYANAVATASERIPNVIGRTKATLQAYRAEKQSDRKMILLRILSRLGGTEAYEELAKALESSDSTVQTAAISSMAEWPTGRPLLAMFDLFKKSGEGMKGIGLRKILASSISQLAGKPTAAPQSEIASLLVEITKAASQNEDDKRYQTWTTLISSFYNIVDPAAAAYLKELKADPELKQSAEAYLVEQKKAMDSIVTPAEDGTLPIEKAVLMGEGALLQEGQIVNWVYPNNLVTWIVNIEKSGKYRLKLDYARPSKEEGGLTVIIGDDSQSVRVSPTADRDTFKEMNAVEITFAKPGVYRIWLTPGTSTESSELMVLRGVKLSP